MHIYLKKATTTTLASTVQGILQRYTICNISIYKNIYSSSSGLNRMLRVKTLLHFSSAISLLQHY